MTAPANETMDPFFTFILSVAISTVSFLIFAGLIFFTVFRFLHWRSTKGSKAQSNSSPPIKSHQPATTAKEKNPDNKLWRISARITLPKAEKESAPPLQINDPIYTGGANSFPLALPKPERRAQALAQRKVFIKPATKPHTAIPKTAAKQIEWINVGTATFPKTKKTPNVSEEEVTASNVLKKEFKATSPRSQWNHRTTTLFRLRPACLLLNENPLCAKSLGYVYSRYKNISDTPTVD